MNFYEKYQFSPDTSWIIYFRGRENIAMKLSWALIISLTFKFIYKNKSSTKWEKITKLDNVTEMNYEWELSKSFNALERQHKILEEKKL